MRTVRRRQEGFSFLEIAIAVLIIVILVAVVLLQVLGVFGGARGSAMETDVHSVKTAVDAYILEALEAPTVDGKFPQSGDYALIDFHASFPAGGVTKSLYPDFLGKLPRHWDEGLWRIDSKAIVSVSIQTDGY
jgi:type II secretory pathway pseudopilin PulG